MNKREEIEKQIHEVNAKKKTNQEAIEKKLQDLSKQIAETRILMQEAQEDLDAGGYYDAKTELEKLQTAEEMYKGRLSQIRKEKLISEADSDAVIESLLAYEKELSEQFESEAKEILRKLTGQLKKYREEVMKTEAVLGTWTANIHPNFRSYTGTTYGSSGTNRSPNPVSVHPGGYVGSEASVSLFNHLATAPGGILYSFGIDYENT